MFIDDINFLISGSIPSSSNEKLVNSHISYLRGNSFSKEYIPYKNYQVREIEVKTEEEELLLKLSEVEFALNDLALYLDLHPNDEMIFNKFKEYVKLSKEYMKKYEEKYRPLDLCSVYRNNYDYYKNPWPWDNDKGVFYV